MRGKGMKRVTALLFIIVLICGVNAPFVKAAENSPKEAIEMTVGGVLDILRDENLSSPDKKLERREKISALIKDRFDFEEMSKRSLARHWKERTPAEKSEFVSIFSDLLISSYLSKIETYTDEKVTFNKEVIKGKGKYGVVSTTILARDVDIPIDYKVIRKKDKWWVYDVVVEGVSFISTYRSQYNKIIVKQSYAKLVERMKKKLDEVNIL
jgi:phospholipid transport system substrate-binding protein